VKPVLDVTYPVFGSYVKPSSTLLWRLHTFCTVP